MYKVCSRCGKMHDFNKPCTCAKYKKVYKGGDERKLRAKNAWKEKSLEIREAADNLCQVCRDEGRYIYKELQVHHIHKVKDEPDRYLDNLNLVCLCPTCHSLAEDGDIDVDYLERLAEEREKKCATP